MKITRKFVLIFIIVLAIVLFTKTVYAFGWTDVDQSATEFLETGAGETYFNRNDLGNLTNGMVIIMVSVGTVASFGTLLILGIKYMTASPEEAAKLKPKFIGAIIAIIVIVGAVGIWQTLGTLFANTSGGVPLNEADFNTEGVNTTLRTPTPKPKTTPTPAAVSSIKFNSASAKLNTRDNKEYTISYIVEPATAKNAKITFSSDNESVATVDKNGVVKAVGSGKTTIRGKTASGKEATMEVEVEVPNLGETYISKFTLTEQCAYIGTVINYWVYIPDVSVIKSYENVPLIIFMHGSGESQSMDRLLKTSLPGYINGYDRFTKDESKRISPAAIVVAPRYPNAAKGWTMPAVEVYATVKQAILDAKERGITVDENRISVTGFSMGGAAAVGALRAYPDMFSSAVLVSPADYPGDVAKASCPIRVYYGSKDQEKYRTNWYKYFGNGQANNITVNIDKSLPNHTDITRIYYKYDAVDFMVNSSRS